MSFLYFLADAFINAFGITRPTEKTRKQAALFIAGLMLLTVAGVVVTGFVIHAAMK